MTTLHRLPLLETLARGEIRRFEPTADAAAGRVGYPDAEAVLGEGADAAAVLGSLAEEGLLEERFERRVFACPECGDDDLDFQTVCPACESPDYRSSGPDEHRCRACEESFAAPDHRLECDRDGPFALPATTELVLSTYEPDGEAVERIDGIVAVRDAAADMLESRGFEVTLDTRLDGPEGAAYVPIYATDDVLGIEIVAAVEEDPDLDDVRSLGELATEADAHPILFTVTDSPDEDVTALAEQGDVVVLSPQADGEGRTPDEADVELQQEGRMLERITSAVRGR